MNPQEYSKRLMGMSNAIMNVETLEEKAEREKEETAKEMEDARDIVEEMAQNSDWAEEHGCRQEEEQDGEWQV